MSALSAKLSAANSKTCIIAQLGIRWGFGAGAESPQECRLFGLEGDGYRVQVIVAGAIGSGLEEGTLRAWVLDSLPLPPSFVKRLWTCCLVCCCPSLLRAGAEVDGNE